MTLFPVSPRTPAPAGVNKRRSFLQQLGIGLSSAIGAAAMAKPGNSAIVDGEAGSLSLQVARLEAEKALRALHQQHEQLLDAALIENAGMESLLALFAADAEVVFDGGVYAGRELGISRLYRQRFAAGHVGKRMHSAPGFAVAAELQQERIEIRADLQTATAVFPYSIQVGRPIESAASLASMARMQGEGVHTWWEGGVYEVSYRKDAAECSWQITRLVYNTLSRADYRAGRSYAKPMQAPAVAACFPVDPLGPDSLV